jgi:hypothetical protein
MIKWLKKILGIKPKLYYQGRLCKKIEWIAIDAVNPGEIWEIEFLDNGATAYAHTSMIKER